MKIKLRKVRKKTTPQCATCRCRHLLTSNQFWLWISYFFNVSSFEIVPWSNLRAAAIFGECRWKKYENMPKSVQYRWDQETTDVLSIHFIRLRKKEQNTKQKTRGKKIFDSNIRFKLFLILERLLFEVWNELSFGKILEKPRANIDRLHFLNAEYSICSKPNADQYLTLVNRAIFYSQWAIVMHSMHTKTNVFTDQMVRKWTKKKKRKKSVKNTSTNRYTQSADALG